MKSLVLTFLLSASAPCFSQAAAQHPNNPDQIFRLPERFQQPSLEISQLPSFQAPLKMTPVPRLVLPGQPPRIATPHLDAQILRKPPANSFAHQQPQTPPAARIYPDLRLLPVQTAQLDVTSIR
jgi:hypothetical protein